MLFKFNCYPDATHLLLDLAASQTFSSSAPPSSDDGPDVSLSSCATCESDSKRASSVSSPRLFSTALDVQSRSLIKDLCGFQIDVQRYLLLLSFIHHRSRYKSNPEKGIVMGYQRGDIINIYNTLAHPHPHPHIHLHRTCYHRLCCYHGTLISVSAS